MELCEICGEGHVTVKIQFFKKQQKEEKVKASLYYKECDVCCSEYCDSVLMTLNTKMYTLFKEFEVQYVSDR